MPSFRCFSLFGLGEQKQIPATQLLGRFEQSPDFPFVDIASAGIGADLDKLGHGPVLEDHEIHFRMLRILPVEDLHISPQLLPV